MTLNELNDPKGPENLICTNVIYEGMFNDRDTAVNSKKIIARPAYVGLVLCNHINYYRFEETSSYLSVKRILVFLCFSLVNQRHISGITVNNPTVTDIENTVRAVHSCNSRFGIIFCGNLQEVIRVM